MGARRRLYCRVRGLGHSRLRPPELPRPWPYGRTAECGPNRRGVVDRVGVRRAGPRPQSSLHRLAGLSRRHQCRGERSMLLLGVLASPITFLFGPVVTWNVLEWAAPFVSALSMCLVLRRWTRWWPAAFVGGLLYGFSSYVTAQAGHLFLVFVPLPPLFFLLLHESLVRQRWSPKRVGALLGLLCVAQFFIFAELFASLVLMGAGATVLYLLANRKHISIDTNYLKTASISAALVGAVLLIYPIFVTLFGPQHINGVPNPPAALAALHGDLAGLVVPGYLQRLALPALRSYYLLNSATMYLGLPLILAIGAIVVLLRRRGIVQLAGALTGISLILSLGSPLYVGSHDTHLPLPFVVLAHLPLTQGFLPTRFSLYTILFGSPIVAIGLDALHHRVVTSRRLGGISPRTRELVATGVLMAGALVIALPDAAIAPTGVISDGRIQILLQPGGRAEHPRGNRDPRLSIPGRPHLPGRRRRILVLAEVPIRQRRPLGSGRFGDALSTDRRVWMAAEWSTIRDPGLESPSPPNSEGSVRLRLLRCRRTSRAGEGSRHEQSDR